MLIKDIREVVGDWYCNAVLISSIACDWKCEKEGLTPLCSCQNSHLTKLPNIELSSKEIIDIYIKHETAKALIFAGLEPMLQIDEILEIIKDFRKEFSEDDIIIFTGYNKEELTPQLAKLRLYKNIYVKFGRYIADSKPKIDPVGGIILASDNQYIEKL